LGWFYVTLRIPYGIAYPIAYKYSSINGSPSIVAPILGGIGLFSAGAAVGALP